MQFSSIIGLEREKEILINSVKNEHIAHAQLFFGSEGSGNLALALAYATYINCTNPSETDSCGECSSCSKLDKLIHPDLHFIFPSVKSEIQNDNDKKVKAENSDDFMPIWRSAISKTPFFSFKQWMNQIGAGDKQGIIKVEESRQVLRKISLKSFEAKYKVMLVWLPELMNPAASNALLKVLEEPTDKTIFLLVSNDKDKLLQTVLSRTQLLQIRNFTDDEIREYLIQQNAGEFKAQQIASMADGNLAYAQDLVHEETSDIFDFFTRWMRLCFKPNDMSILDLSKEYEKIGKEAQKNLFKYGLRILHFAILQSNGATSLVSLPEKEKDFVQKFSGVLKLPVVDNLNNIFNQHFYHLERNANVKTTFLAATYESIRAFKAV